MKSVDAKLSTYIDFDIETNREDPKFKVGNHVRISKYKIFLKHSTFQIGVKIFLLLKSKKYCSVDIYY